jgi:hypothetical protein
MVGLYLTYYALLSVLNTKEIKNIRTILEGLIKSFKIQNLHRQTDRQTETHTHMHVT